MVPVFLERGEISPIYERVTYQRRWEYNLYAVVHDYDRGISEKSARKGHPRELNLSPFYNPIFTT